MAVIYKIFVYYAALIPICVCLGSYVIKHYIPKFNNKLIPIVNLVISIVLMLCWCPLIRAGYPIQMRLFNGILYGFASTGIHQLGKQTIEYFKVRKYVKHRGTVKIKKVNL